MEIKDRICYYMTRNNITNSALERHLSISNGLWAKSGTISENVLIKFIQAYPNVSCEWLLTGKGEMIKSDNVPEQASVVGTIHAKQSEVSVTQTNGACQSELVAHLKSLLEEKERTIQVQQQLIDALRKP